MAEGAVAFVLKKLDTMVRGEVMLLRGMHRDARCIRDDLESMKDFLREADRSQDSDQATKTWVMQLRQAAYDIEDVLDRFLLTLPPSPSQQQQQQCCGIVHHRQKITWAVKKWKLNHQIGTQMQEIKRDVKDIYDRGVMYNFIGTTHAREQRGASSSHASTSYDPRSEALLLEEDEVVGIDDIKDCLIHQLLAENNPSKLEVMSVVGMGGLGKTTLVKKIYDDRDFHENFNCHVWVSVSQSFKVEDLLKEILEQLYKNENPTCPNISSVTNEVKLKSEVKKQLQNKRYVIVLDDIWSPDAWEALKHAFPNSNCGSRIIITTRLSDLRISGGEVFKLTPLPAEESWKLFCMKAFQSNTCSDPQLGPLSEKMLEKCDGLPLAIVALGKLLAKKEKTITEWERVSRSLGEELQSDCHLRPLKNILYLSYNDLPYDLKSCFLYLAIFSEARPIDCKKLIRLWCAEGLVEEKSKLTIEEVGERYLMQLINRSLVQKGDTHDDGRLRTCHIHDLVRETFRPKAREELFATENGSSSVRHNYIRHLSVNQKVENAPDQNITTMINGSSFSRLRSLLVFSACMPPPNSSMSTFFNSLRLLRVLDLSGASRLLKFPEEVVNLILLKYLSLRGSKIDSVPNSIGKLQNLETLDLKDTNISNNNFPVTGIRKLKRLRYLAVYSYKEREGLPYYVDVLGFKAFKGIGDLTSLQKLGWIEVDHEQGSDDIIKELAKLRQLRRLAARELKYEDGIHLCSSIEKMTHLQSLSVKAKDDVILDLHHITSPPSCLQRLYLRGRMRELPKWICSLDSLVGLALHSSGLKGDALDSIQHLPNLAHLELYRTFNDEKQEEASVLCFKAGGFRKLRCLQLIELEQLQEIRVEEEALCDLQEMWIFGCRALRMMAMGIEYLTQLKWLRFSNNLRRACLRDMSNRHGRSPWGSNMRI